MKKGDKIVLKRPLKVVDVYEGDNITTVTVRVVFTSYFGDRIVDEIELPRSLVKLFREEKNKMAKSRKGIKKC